MGVVYFSIIPTFEPSRYCKCWIVCFFYRNLQAKQMVEDAQLKQGECYNPKKAIFDRATEEVNKQLKRQMILYKRRIKELELQIELLEEENQRLKANR